MQNTSLSQQYYFFCENRIEHMTSNSFQLLLSNDHWNHKCKYGDGLLKDLSLKMRTTGLSRPS